MYTYRLVLLLVFALFIFSPVILDWWLSSPTGWYRPFVFWFGLILISIWLEKWQDVDDI